MSTNNFTDTPHDGDNKRFLDNAENQGLTDAIITDQNMRTQVADELAQKYGSNVDAAIIAQTPEGQRTLNELGAELAREARIDPPGAGVLAANTAPLTAGQMLYEQSWQQPAPALQPEPPQQPGVSKTLLNALGVDLVALGLAAPKPAPNYVMQPGMT